MRPDEVFKRLRAMPLADVVAEIGEERARDLVLLVRPRRELFRVDIPVRFDNPLNGSQGRWQAKANKRAALRDDVAWSLKRLSCYRLEAGAEYAVTMTRFRVTGAGMDSDGLAAALKPLQDEIAKALGRDDAERAGIHWRRTQEHQRGHGVRVGVEVLH